jgi:hypothetical protein
VFYAQLLRLFGWWTIFSLVAQLTIVFPRVRPLALLLSLPRRLPLLRSRLPSCCPFRAAAALAATTRSRRSPLLMSVQLEWPFVGASAAHHRAREFTFLSA